MSVDVYFPMAGQGARFGGTFKPFLEIDNERFIEAAVRPFRQHLERIRRFVFVYLEAQEREYRVSAQLEKSFAGLPWEAVRLPTSTRGPAETIARAVEQRDGHGAAFVCDCDHELDVSPLFEQTDTDFAALLPVWPLEGEDLASWSVAMVKEGKTLAIAEKRLPETTTGTPMGVIGCYGFRDIATVAARVSALAAINFSDVLREMLSRGDEVRVATIARARFFGDPQRLADAQTRGNR